MTHNPKQVLQYDNLDDRREIHQLLARLPPVERVRFDVWCCARASLPHFKHKPEVMAKTWRLAELARWDSSADERLTYEVWMDLWQISINYQFSLDVAVIELASRVRHFCRV